MKKYVDKLKGLFVKTDYEKIVEKVNIDSNNVDLNTIVQNLFTKNDPKSLTEFPYDWSEEFFPPLTQAEKRFMRTEITRWFETYVGMHFDKISEAIITYILKPENNNEWARDYYKSSSEAFTLMSKEIVKRHIQDEIRDSINSLSDEKTICWRPTESQDCWLPPSKQMTKILKSLTNVVLEEGYAKYEQQLEDLSKIQEIQNMELSEDLKRQKFINSLEFFLNSHKRELVNNCFDRLMNEYDAFPYYYGKKEKRFNNEIFHKYRLRFGCTTYNELFGKVFVPLKRYIDTYSKKQVKTWLIAQWDEYVDFLTNYYVSKNEKELFDISVGQFNAYAFAVDFYAIILFKIKMDGIY